MKAYPNPQLEPLLHPINTFFFPVALRPNVGHGLLIHEVSRSHTTTQHSRQDSSGRVISSSQRPLPDNTRHSQQTNIHTAGGIRTHDLNWRAAADLCLRPRGHWDRHTINTRRPIRCWPAFRLTRYLRCHRWMNTLPRHSNTWYLRVLVKSLHFLIGCIFSNC